MFKNKNISYGRIVWLLSFKIIQAKKKQLSHDVLSSTGIKRIPWSSRVFRSVGIGYCCPAARRYWFFVAPHDELQRTAWGRKRILRLRHVQDQWETRQHNGFCSIFSSNKKRALSVSAVTVPTLGIFAGQFHNTQDDWVKRYWDDGSSTLPILFWKGHDEGDTCPKQLLVLGLVVVVH